MHEQRFYEWSLFLELHLMVQQSNVGKGSSVLIPSVGQSFYAEVVHLLWPAWAVLCAVQLFFQQLKKFVVGRQRGSFVIVFCNMTPKNITPYLQDKSWHHARNYVTRVSKLKAKKYPGEMFWVTSPSSLRAFHTKQERLSTSRPRFWQGWVGAGAVQ